MNDIYFSDKFPHLDMYVMYCIVLLWLAMIISGVYCLAKGLQLNALKKGRDEVQGGAVGIHGGKEERIGRLKKSIRAGALFAGLSFVGMVVSTALLVIIWFAG